MQSHTNLINPGWKSVWKHQFVSKKDVADVHHHCGLTRWALLMIIDEKIVSIDIHMLTEKTGKICETICSVKRPVYN